MLQVAGHEQWLLVVFVLAFFGFGVKAAVFPLSGWLPSAGVAPTPVTALLHAVAVVNAGVYALVRLIYYTFGTEFLSGSWAQYVVMSAALVTIVYGSSMALRTPHLKTQVGVFNGKQPFLYGIWFDTDDSCGYGRRFDPYGGSLHFKNSCILLCGRHSL